MTKEKIRKLVRQGKIDNLSEIFKIHQYPQYKLVKHLGVTDKRFKKIMDHHGLMTGQEIIEFSKFFRIHWKKILLIAVKGMEENPSPKYRRRL